MENGHTGAIRQILGHSCVTTTMRYGMLMEDDLQSALEETSQMC